MGVEFLFTWPNDLPNRSFFHTVILLPVLLWPSFGFKLQWRHSLVKHVVQGWRLVSILLPYLSVHCFLILLIQIVPMWMCWLDFPTQSLHVSFLSWALFNTADVEGWASRVKTESWSLGRWPRIWEHTCHVRASSHNTCLKVNPKLGNQADKQRRH